jgi:hypothetical protein
VRPKPPALDRELEAGGVSGWSGAKAVANVLALPTKSPLAGMGPPDYRPCDADRRPRRGDGPRLRRNLATKRLVAKTPSAPKAGLDAATNARYRLRDFLTSKLTRWQCAIDEPSGFKGMKRNANDDGHLGELHVASVVCWNDSVCRPDLQHVLGSKVLGSKQARANPDLARTSRLQKRYFRGSTLAREVKLARSFVREES